MPRRDAFSRLLVEGKNDQHIVWALCKQYAVPETFTVEIPKSEVDSGGVDKLLSSIAIYVLEPGLRSLGIVIDADERPQDRWRSIQNHLSEAGYSGIPDVPDRRGMILTAPLRPRIGVWMMPNNALTGSIEDFSRLLIDSADPLLLTAEETVASLEQRNIQRFRPTHRSKALLHTWLAWQDPPGMPMGTALTAKALNPESPLATQFVDWIQRLFAAHIPA